MINKGQQVNNSLKALSREPKCQTLWADIIPYHKTFSILIILQRVTEMSIEILAVDILVVFVVH